MPRLKPVKIPEIFCAGLAKVRRESPAVLDRSGTLSSHSASGEGFVREEAPIIFFCSGMVDNKQV